MCPQNSGKYFSGNYHVKLGHFSGKYGGGVRIVSLHVGGGVLPNFSCDNSEMTINLPKNTQDFYPFS